MRILEINDFVTPYTDVFACSDTVRLEKSYYSKGYYPFEGVEGYFAYRLKKRAQITSLQTKKADSWQTWMVDDPLHWFGMKEIADCSRPGNILVAGLGLGLILHHLCLRNNVTSIDVVEKNSDVIKFVSQFLPQDKRINIIRGDYFDCVSDLKRKRYRTVILDLWVRDDSFTDEQIRIMAHEMDTGYGISQLLWPMARVMVWGNHRYGAMKIDKL